MCKIGPEAFGHVLVEIDRSARWDYKTCWSRMNGENFSERRNLNAMSNKETLVGLRQNLGVDNCQLSSSWAPATPDSTVSCLSMCLIFDRFDLCMT